MNDKGRNEATSLSHGNPMKGSLAKLTDAALPLVFIGFVGSANFLIRSLCAGGWHANSMAGLAWFGLMCASSLVRQLRRSA